MAEHGHFIERCKICDRVISQCRCASSDKEKRFSVCRECAVEQRLEKLEATQAKPKAPQSEWPEDLTEEQLQKAQDIFYREPMGHETTIAREWYRALRAALKGGEKP